MARMTKEERQVKKSLEEAQARQERKEALEALKKTWVQRLFIAVSRAREVNELNVDPVMNGFRVSVAVSKKNIKFSDYYMFSDGAVILHTIDEDSAYEQERLLESLEKSWKSYVESSNEHARRLTILEGVMSKLSDEDKAVLNISIKAD